MIRKNTLILGFLIIGLVAFPAGSGLAAAKAPLAGEGGWNKMASPGLENKFDDQGRLRVIALLKGYQSYAGAERRSGPEFAASLRERVARLQDRALIRISPDESTLGPRPLNFPILTLEVTRKGLAQLKASELVETVQEDRRLQLNTRQGLELIGAEQTRSLYGGNGVSVALIDSGVDYTHPALGGTIQGYGTFPNEKIIGGYDFGEDDPDPMDNSGHGTTVSALAGGLNTNVGDYIGGVAPLSGLYMLKVTGANGAIFSSDLIAAWDWILTHQHDDPARPIMVVSVSLGTPGFQTDEYCDDLNPAESLVTSSLAQAGIAVFVSSGNYGICDGVSYPACLKNTISVGAVYDAALGPQPGQDLVYCTHHNSCVGGTTSTCPYGGFCRDDQTAADMVPCYSNSGTILDLLAPANCSYVPTKDGYLSCFYGTSGSCAIAAGAAAVVQSFAQAALNRFLGLEELKDVLKKGGALILDPKSNLKTPRVDIQGAVNRLK